MKIVFNFIFLVLFSSVVWARGGDDVGNGGFAYKQSVIILKMATSALEEKIRISTYKDLIDFPERRLVLQNTLGYEDLDKLSKKNQRRGGRKLAMNYIVNPQTVIVLMPYFEAFAGKTDRELEDASLEVQKRLLHEASHIWGYKEDVAEKFAIEFLANIENNKRPTQEVEIRPGYCSCLKGQVDSGENCEDFCNSKPITPYSVLYLETILGDDIIKNPKLGNLYNWCNAKLDGDLNTPQCSLVISDKADPKNNISVNIDKNSNSLTANIDSLSYDKTYILKLVETRSGSNAESSEFQVTRKAIVTDPTDPIGKITITPINQYSCLSFSGYSDPSGENRVRTGYIRSFYYFSGAERPDPMPPLSWVVCHDEQVYPGNDSIEYFRLETVERLFSLWNNTDPMFQYSDPYGKLKIDSIIETRLYMEYGIQSNVNLFYKIGFKNGPIDSRAENSLGFMTTYFTRENGEVYCPTHLDNKNPVERILSDYIGDTEGLYLAEKEAEILQTGGHQQIFYGTMFVNEALLKKYGFYLNEYSEKVLINGSSFNNKNIYYYWPTSDSTDPLIKGARKLYTVKNINDLHDEKPTGIRLTPIASDKRIGCIPKGKI